MNVMLPHFLFVGAAPGYPSHVACSSITGVPLSLFIVSLWPTKDLCYIFIVVRQSVVLICILK
jgi:hypothetical protein